jgi:isopenicillin-N epimerase
MLEHWALDPAITYLNHGTVGAPPRRVLAAQQAIRDEIERQPSRFLLRELVAQLGDRTNVRPRLRAAIAPVAEFFGARADDMVFIDNATTGANVVLRSFPLERGDEILIHDHTYGGVRNAALHAARERGATVRTVELPWPMHDSAGITRAYEAALGPRTRLVLVDHVSSESALVFPVADVAAVCRARGVPVLVDGAHAPGAIALDIPSLGVDWYFGNLHKWAWSPRSCAILWAKPERHAALHPAITSWGFDQGFVTEFEWSGTHDPSAYLAAPAGLELMREFGVEAVRSYDHALAWSAAQHLARRWGTEVEVGEATVGTMVTLALPERLGSTKDEAMRLRDALLFEDRIEIQLHAWRGRLRVRVSAQIYNDLDDIERLAAAVEARAGSAARA